MHYIIKTKDTACGLKVKKSEATDSVKSVSCKKCIDYIETFAKDIFNTGWRANRNDFGKKIMVDPHGLAHYPKDQGEIDAWECLFSYQNIQGKGGSRG